MLNVGAIKEGFVLDHIKAGMSLSIYHDLKLDELDCCVAIIKNAKSNKMGKKDILKVECNIDNLDLDILGFIDHNITVNIIKDERIVEKRALKLPTSVTNVIKCKNPRCITSIEQELDQIFLLTDEEKEFLTELHLLTMKPVLYVANVAEDEVAAPENNPHVQAVRKYAEEEGAETIVVSAKMESEIAELPEDEAKEFLEMAGLEEAGLDRLIKAGFKLLGLMTYLTAGETESRAWTIKRGTKAPQAAGKIHSDFERGFIRAEIVSYDDLVACGSKAAARDKGLVRLEGKDYVMQDGDVVEFRFNV